MAFQKDKTTVAQTATNAAAQVVAALVTAGVITDRGTAGAVLTELRDEQFDALSSIVDADNEMFRAEESRSGGSSSGSSSGSGRRSGGSSGGSRGRSSGGSSGSISLADAQNTKLRFGAFAAYDDDGNYLEDKSLSLGEVFELSGDEAAEYGYGEGEKDGRQYVRWLANNKDERKSFMAKRAKVIIEAARGGDDE